jgi:hypothetical protein
VNVYLVGAELFHADRWTEMTKLIAVFRSFAKAHKMGLSQDFLRELRFSPLSIFIIASYSFLYSKLLLVNEKRAISKTFHSSNVKTVNNKKGFQSNCRFKYYFIECILCIIFLAFSLLSILSSMQAV